MDDATMKEVNGAIQGFVKSGQKLKVTTKVRNLHYRKKLKPVSFMFHKFCFQVDPSIIGGMIVSIGDKYVDMSIAHRIKQYTKIMEESM